MPLIPAKCTNCGGTLEVDSTKDAAICPHCGSAFITEKAINNYNTYNQIQADTVIVQGGRDFEISGGVLKAYNGADVDVVVPDGVVEIGNDCFRGMRIRSIVLPEGLEKIGSGVFETCVNLQKIDLPESLREIAGQAFWGCTALQNVQLPENLQTLGHQVFKECGSLLKITIPANIKEIGYEVFYGCNSLCEIFLPEGLITIGDRAFSECPSLTSIRFPNSLQEFGFHVFEGCKGLTSVWLPANTHDLFNGRGESVFVNCSNLQQVHSSEREEDYLTALNFGGTPVYKRYEWKRRGRCAYCGGSFKGMFNKVCASCGRPKDY